MRKNFNLYISHAAYTYVYMLNTLVNHNKTKTNAPYAFLKLYYNIMH